MFPKKRVNQKELDKFLSESFTDLSDRGESAVREAKALVKHMRGDHEHGVGIEIKEDAAVMVVSHRDRPEMIAGVSHKLLPLMIQFKLAQGEWEPIKLTLRLPNGEPLTLPEGVAVFPPTPPSLEGAMNRCAEKARISLLARLED